MKHQTFCNPLDLSYRYQHMLIKGERSAFREGADPTLIFFKGTYYIFVSMASGFWYSEDLLDWKFHGNKDLLIYDYAPDVRQVGDYLYFCASRRGVNCPILRSANPLMDDFEEVSAPFDFWDPDLFCDDDGRVYFYWGCSNMDPIFGVEMDPVTMKPKGGPIPLMEGCEDKVELLGRYGWADCANSWTWDVEPGSDIKVEVYSAAEEVELIVNGVSAGRQSAGKDNHYKACFLVKYEPGTLEAVSYTGGKKVCCDCVKSAGAPKGLKITPDACALSREMLKTDGQSLCFAQVDVVDEEGNLIPYAEAEISAKVEGVASLAAFGTGRPVTEENYTAGKAVSYHGKALAVIRSGYQAGVAKLIVSADGLESAELEISVEA